MRRCDSFFSSYAKEKCERQNNIAFKAFRYLSLRNGGQTGKSHLREPFYKILDLSKQAKVVSQLNKDPVDSLTGKSLKRRQPRGKSIRKDPKSPLEEVSSTLISMGEFSDGLVQRSEQQVWVYFGDGTGLSVADSLRSPAKPEEEEDGRQISISLVLMLACFFKCKKKSL